MPKFFYGNNPHSNKPRPTPTLRPVNMSKEQLRDFRNLLSDPRTSQNIKKDLWLTKQAVIVPCVVI
jgi:hypothetical protein